MFVTIYLQLRFPISGRDLNQGRIDFMDGHKSDNYTFMLIRFFFKLLLDKNIFKESRYKFSKCIKEYWIISVFVLLIRALKYFKTFKTFTRIWFSSSAVYEFILCHIRRLTWPNAFHCIKTIFFFCTRSRKKFVIIFPI